MSEAVPTRRPGRPPRLSRDAVVEAAEAVIAREGIDALTMRRLAQELESSPMAVYRHVRDKDELLMLLLDRRAADVPHPELPDDPRGRLLVLFRLIYDGLRESPWIVEVLVKGDLIAPSILWVVDEILAAFRAAGLAPDRAAAAYHVAWRYTVGEVSVRHASARHLAELDRPPVVRSIVARLAEELPTLVDLGGEMAAARDGLSYDEGLAAVVDGLLAWAPPNRGWYGLRTSTHTVKGGLMSTEARSAEETRGRAAWRAPDVIPGLSYEDAPAAIEWLEQAFGFERHAVHEGEGGKIVHAELRVGSGMVMLGSEREGAAREHFPVTTPRKAGALTAGFYVIVDDPDAHYERAKAAGAEIVMELTDQDYGSRDYTARDLEGHIWTFGTYRPSAG